MAVSQQTMGANPIGLLDWFAPEWAIRAEKRIRTYPDKVRSVLFVMALLVFGVGFVGAVGGGYWSIQGVRELLRWLGFTVSLTGIPAAPWWLIPIANTLIQLTARRIPEVRRGLWAPSLWFDGSTTGIYLGRSFLPAMLATMGAGWGAYLTASAVGAMLGMVVAVIVEHMVLGGLVLMRGALYRPSAA